MVAYPGASPALMLIQALVLPLWLAFAAGSPGAQGGGIGWQPFAQAFVLMIALPMGLSILTRRASSRFRPATRLASATTALMVPLMMATLALVVASQVPHVASRPDVVARVVPLFVTFALVMPAVGDVVGCMAHQGSQERLALAFSGPPVTRWWFCRWLWHCPILWGWRRLRWWFRPLWSSSSWRSVSVCFPALFDRGECGEETDTMMSKNDVACGARTSPSPTGPCR